MNIDSVGNISTPPRFEKITLTSGNKTNHSNEIQSSCGGIIPPLPPLPSLLSPSPSPMTSSSSSSSSLLIKSLQKQNELQKKKLRIIEKEKHDMLNTIEILKDQINNMKQDEIKERVTDSAKDSVTNFSKDQTSNNPTSENVMKTLKQLDIMATQFKAPSIRSFLVHIKTVVNSIHEQLIHTENEMNEIKETNKVLKSCLERARKKNRVKNEENDHEKDTIQDDEVGLIKYPKQDR